MALTSAEKQKAYRDRERVKLEALRQAANGRAPRGNVTDDEPTVAEVEAERAAAEAENCRLRGERWKRWAPIAWMADHPGHTVDDFKRYGSCGATPEEAAEFGRWASDARVQEAEAKAASRIAELEAEVAKLKAKLERLEGVRRENRQLKSQCNQYFAALGERVLLVHRRGEK